MFIFNFAFIYSELAAQDVLVFVREAVHKLPHLRSVILQQLTEVFATIRNIKVFRAALWILGEYSDTEESIQGTLISFFIFTTPNHRRNNPHNPITRQTTNH